MLPKQTQPLKTWTQDLTGSLWSSEIEGGSSVTAASHERSIRLGSDEFGDQVSTLGSVITVEINASDPLVGLLFWVKTCQILADMKSRAQKRKLKQQKETQDCETLKNLLSSPHSASPMMRLLHQLLRLWHLTACH